MGSCWQSERVREHLALFIAPTPLGAALDHLGKMVEPLLLAGVGDDLGREQRLLRLAENYLRGCLLPEFLTLQRIAYASGEKALGQVFAKEDAALAVMIRQMAAIGTPKPELDAEIFLAMVQGQVHEKVLLGVESPQKRRGTGKWSRMRCASSRRI